MIGGLFLLHRARTVEIFLLMVHYQEWDTVPIIRLSRVPWQQKGGLLVSSFLQQICLAQNKEKENQQNKDTEHVKKVRKRYTFSLIQNKKSRSVSERRKTKSFL